ncbi:MAG: 16S rRNA (guanine(527)-N(7))-methyltransferase RsmG [Alphaproteobacteria bacterium]|nr:16S rRNA (guanine(527)-N(7))-methyltransferase RsmG [Alphaproteobacteria bacterium]
MAERGAAPLTPEQFRAAADVSRETIERLQAYEAMLRKWQKAINLVGPRTLNDVWRRHFLDSAQLLPLAPAGAQTWLDLGSGGGFPGLVLAVLGAPLVHMVESDQRKAAFLREAARAAGATNVVFHVKRVEAMQRVDLGAPIEVITARALATPAEILAWTKDIATAATIYLLLGGQGAGQALTEARKNWTMSAEALPSRTDSESRILRIWGVSREPSISS